MPQTKLNAEPPKVYLRPACGDDPPMIFVGNDTVITIEDRGRAAHWVRVLTDYVLSKPR